MLSDVGASGVFGVEGDMTVGGGEARQAEGLGSAEEALAEAISQPNNHKRRIFADVMHAYGSASSIRLPTSLTPEAAREPAMVPTGVQRYVSSVFAAPPIPSMVRPPLPLASGSSVFRQPTTSRQSESPPPSAVRQHSAPIYISPAFLTYKAAAHPQQQYHNVQRSRQLARDFTRDDVTSGDRPSAALGIGQLEEASHELEVDVQPYGVRFAERLHHFCEGGLSSSSNGRGRKSESIEQERSDFRHRASHEAVALALTR